MIIYLGKPSEFDAYTARLIMRAMYQKTGTRALVVVHPKAES